ncbi:MAG: mechanosensitive ion channel family protein [Cyanobacteria bacterium]|nr:mechanosensitive ion channel family protein [Cyanobacteriota bacterium]
MLSKVIAVVFVLVTLFTQVAFCTISSAQEKPTAPRDEAPAAVVQAGNRIFVYHATIEGQTPTERVQKTVDAIRALVQDPSFEPGSLKLNETPQGTNIVYGDQIIATVSIDDAKAEHSSTRLLASGFLAKLRGVMSTKARDNTGQQVATGIGITVACTIMLVLAIVLLLRIVAKCVDFINLETGKRVRAVKIQEAELLSAETAANLICSILQITQFGLIALGLYAYAIIVLASFPTTAGFADTLWETSSSPVWQAFDHLLAYLPNLLAIIVIGIITYATIAFARFIFDAVGAGTITFSGFRKEWAQPTYKLTRLFIVAFFLVLALPYAPGYESDSFKQVGILFGLLISLGSTSVIGHLMAGVVLTYTNAFSVGDRIKVADCIGDVLEKTMFVTRVRTIKNEVVSIPNGSVLNAQIINFSNMATEGKLILYTNVTIGYDAPFRTVQNLLKSAAKDANGVLSDPEPFVLQKELTDFSITYELNAFTDDARSMFNTYSNLHEQIIEKFNQAGVEIMSPNYLALRDGNQITIPDSALDKRSFRVAVDRPDKS